MNARKLLDWRKLLIYSHRWMGIFFGLLFFAWFVSGIAFMYWSMPSLTAEERLAHQDFVDFSKATLSPMEAAIMMDIADEAMAGVPMQDAVWLDKYDNYWRSREGARNLPVLRVRYLDKQQTWLYLDPHRGTMSKLEWIDRVDRWAYAALHEFDFPWLYERRPHWDIVLILASIGGAVLSFTTLWPTCRRLARHGRRFARVLRSSLDRVGS